MLSHRLVILNSRYINKLDRIEVSITVNFSLKDLRWIKVRRKSSKLSVPKVASCFSVVKWTYFFFLLCLAFYQPCLRWLAQTKVITLKTQLHAIHERWKRMSQRSFTTICVMDLDKFNMICWFDFIVNIRQNKSVFQYEGCLIWGRCYKHFWTPSLGV